MNNTKDIVLILGYPASGKSTVAKEYTNIGYTLLNRDTIGGTIADLLPRVREEVAKGNTLLALDNLFPIPEVRKPFVDLAKELAIPISCVVMDTKIEDAQYNASMRMVRKYGKLLGHGKEIAVAGDPNMFPPAVQFAHRKVFVYPTVEEGFESVTKFGFKRVNPITHINKAIILDYDGTLRETLDGSFYPLSPDNIKVLPNREKVLKHCQSKGYILCGVSNQSGVARGELTHDMACQCFEKTNELLGLGKKGIDYNFCPHPPAPIACYCRKPMPGLGAYLVEKYKLDNSQCIFVGDMTTDETFAHRSGFKYVDQADFFADPDRFIK